MSNLIEFCNNESLMETCYFRTLYNNNSNVLLCYLPEHDSEELSSETMIIKTVCVY